MRYSLAVIFTLFIVTTGSAQASLQYHPLDSSASFFNFQIKADYLPRFQVRAFPLPKFENFTIPEITTGKMQPLPVVYAVNELPMFCKWEAKLEKAAAFPIKIRLGEVQYVERLEGKY